PEGTHENSPGLEPWDGMPELPRVPEGRFPFLTAVREAGITTKSGYLCHLLALLHQCAAAQF
ncbi:MAG TPA: hypothetical protein VK731_06005, partial [Candidatus Cybelea sp.]|nr:hypothetical protein [Candidatus Cybelea sp.]